MRQPTLRQIQAFKAFVETGTVSKAADLLSISQPAASKLLTHLEEDSGLRLLERGHGRMNVTERGMRLYEEIDRIFSGVDQISQAIETIRQEDRGHLIIGLMPAVPSQLMAQTVKIFTARHPEVYLSFVVRSSQFIVDGILSRNFDFGIVLRPLDHDQFRSDIIDDGPLVAAVPKDHKLANRDVLTIKEICSEPFLAYNKSSVSRQALDRLVSGNGLELNIVMEATTAATLIAFVAQGLGIAVVHPIQKSEHLTDVTFVPLKDQIPLPIHAIRASSSRRDMMIDEFIDLFKEVLSKSLK